MTDIRETLGIDLESPFWEEAVAAGIQDVLLIPCTIRYITEHLPALIVLL